MEGRDRHSWLDSTILLQTRHLVIPNPSLIAFLARARQELMEGRDLHSRLDSINRAGGRTFAWQNRGRMVALDIARALHWLHTWVMQPCTLACLPCNLRALPERMQQQQWHWESTGLH